MTLKTTENSVLQNKHERVFYFDILRTIACICVIIIHATGEIVDHADVFAGEFVFATAINSLARIAVPLFVMISGALMLDENYNFTVEKQKKHIKKILIFFVFWSVCYCVFFQIIRPIMKNTQISIKDIILNLLTGYHHLWYCFMIIGIYLFLPLFRLWVKKENKKYIQYFLILAFIFNFFFRQIAEIGVKFTDWFYPVEYIFLNRGYLDYVGGFSFYYILGWYIKNFPPKKTKFLYAGGILGYLISSVGSVLLSRALGEQCLTLVSFSPNVALHTAAIFVFAQAHFQKDSHTAISKFTHSIAKYSLGIYGIHELVRVCCSIAFETLKINNSLIIVPVSIILTFIISYLACFIMSKLPLLKKVV